VSALVAFCIVGGELRNKLTQFTFTGGLIEGGFQLVQGSLGLAREKSFQILRFQGKNARNDGFVAGVELEFHRFAAALCAAG
jgi:hypothetical protein